MSEQVICNLFVLGQVAVGKTTLINKIVNDRIKYLIGTNGLKPADWVIEENNKIVLVDIKERRALDQLINNTLDKKIPEKSIVILVINPRLRNRGNGLHTNLRDYLKNVPKTCIVLIIINSSEEYKITETTYKAIKLRHPNIREILKYDFHKEELDDFKYLLKNIILNTFTNKLEFVKKLIYDNLISKNPTLDLGNCSLTSLYEIEELFENTHIERLILSNEWAAFRNIKWHKISSENKGGKNTLSNFPPEIKKLINLKDLIAGGDWNDGKTWWNRFRINDLTPILNLTKLEYLNISNNNLQYIPSLARLKNLKVLHLNNNSISKVNIRTTLKSIEEIYLSNNQLTTVTFLNHLPFANTIDIHGNKIKSILPIVDQIKRLDITNTKWEQNTINVAKNPLEQPPIEIVNNSKEAVLSYFIDISKGRAFINKDVKLILVGNSEVGKTTLAKYFNNEIDLEKDHLPTHWLEEKQLKSKHIINKIKEKCNINLFDFGGHDYFHDTHHLFFGKNTVYLLLWDQNSNKLNFRNIQQKTKEGNLINVETQDYPLKYWLDSIKYFIKEKSSQNFDFEIDKRDEFNSHVLVVQNKVNEVREIVHLNNADIITAYPFIYEFANIALKPKRNLEYLDSLITDLLNKTKIIGVLLPGYYGVIKKNIKTYSGSPILSIKEFRKYCNSLLGITITYDQTIFLADYLKEIGIILYYPLTNRDKIYVNKKWVIDQIYLILEDLSKRNGEFDENYLKTLFFGKLTDDEISSIIQLMIEFKIIFNHPESNNFIAPLYLPSKPNHAVSLFIDSKKSPYRRFSYTGFIHKNVILNFFQEYGKFVIKDNSNKELFYYWKDGLVIKDEITQEIVMIKFYLGDNEGNASIDIIKLNNEANTEFVENIIHYLKEINSGYETEEMITINGQDFIPLALIHENEEKEIGGFQFNNKYYKLSEFKKHLRKPSKMKNIFISYSKQDIGFVNKFIEHLSALQQDGKVGYWYCSELRAGSEWDKDIKKAFEEADIVCFMISPNLMKTKYIHEYEIAKAFEKRERNPEFKIVPIILDFCRWTTDKNNLGQFTALPYTAKPVADFDNQNMAWYIIQECLRLIIDGDIDPKGDEFYSTQKLPSDILKIFKRIVEDKVDKSGK